VIRLRPGTVAVGLLLSVALLSLVGYAAAACGGNRGSAASHTPRAGSSIEPSAQLSGTITVFAAASLTDAFKDVGKAFETDNPGAQVRFNFAGSSVLAVQINQGAPADVFASADPPQMALVSASRGTTQPSTFATNVPVVIVPLNSSAVKSFADLAKHGVKLVLAAPAVPIGNYARQIFTNASRPGGISPSFSADVLANLRSNETDVKAVVAKIEIGEGDAGIVYATDASAARGKVVAVSIPRQYNVVANYPIAVIKDSRHADEANAFRDFVLSPSGQAILAKYGFGKPSATTPG
jgi:molybdate transport system substrate-binding protein